MCNEDVKLISRDSMRMHRFLPRDISCHQEAVTDEEVSSRCSPKIGDLHRMYEFPSLFEDSNKNDILIN